MIPCTSSTHPTLHRCNVMTVIAKSILSLYIYINAYYVYNTYEWYACAWYIELKVGNTDIWRWVGLGQTSSSFMQAGLFWVSYFKSTTLTSHLSHECILWDGYPALCFPPNVRRVLPWWFSPRYGRQLCLVPAPSHLLCLEATAWHPQKHPRKGDPAQDLGFCFLRMQNQKPW
jgi:hypothetical protein